MDTPLLPMSADVAGAMWALRHLQVNRARGCVRAVLVGDDDEPAISFVVAPEGGENPRSSSVYGFIVIGPRAGPARLDSGD